MSFAQNQEHAGMETIDRIPVRTYSQIAYDELRRRILDGRLPAGAKVTVRIIAEEFGLSPTPIKNALTALEAEGFLESVAHRGHSVPVIDRQTLTEAFEVLEALDVFVAKKIASSPNRSEIVARLQELVDHGDASESANDGSGYELDFHKVMWQYAENQQLIAIAERQRGIVLVASGGLSEPPERRRQVKAEHQAIIDRLKSGDVDGMTAACATHLKESAVVIIEGKGTR